MLHFQIIDFFLWLVGALVCTNYHYQVSRALGLIICSPEYKMLVQNGQKRYFQPTPNIFFAHIFWTFFCLNHKTKRVRPFWVEKLTRSASWGILWVPKHRKKTGFKFSNKNFQKWQKWPWHIQENLKWVGVVFQRKKIFLAKKVNKQLKSLWVTKESPQTGHLRKKVVFYKSCIFSYIGKEKIFSGPFGDVHSDFFQNTR